MGPGFQRYALVLLMLAGGTTLGCSKGTSSSSQGFAHFASTAAPSSGSAGNVTSAAVAAKGPVLTSAVWEDKDGNGVASRGDVIKLVFDQELAFKSARVDASKELSLPVTGDSLGTGATIAPDSVNLRAAVLTLGAQAHLKIAAAFVSSQTSAGSPSGIAVVASATGQITGKTGCAIRTGPAIDVGGTAAAGFHDGASMVIARGGHEAVLLDDGRVLAVGGMRDGVNQSFAEESEIYDPVTGVWTTLTNLSGPTKGRMMNDKGTLPVYRINHTVTKLQDGTVLITGGFGEDRKGFFGLGSVKKEVIGDAHLFDPTTNTFTRIGSLENARHSHTATLLADGRVLIAGGYSDSFWSQKKTLAPFELYDPATRTFSEETHWLVFTQGTVEKRMNHAAIVTDQGVLLAGGEHWKGGFLHFFGTPVQELDGGSEVFQKNSFQKSGGLVHPRRFCAMVSLPSKQVILAGGHDDKAVVDSLESWDTATGNWTDVAHLASPRTNARVVVHGEDAFVIGGFRMGASGVAEEGKVEVYSGAQKALGASYDLKVARNGATATTLADGRILVAGGFSGGTKSVTGMDGQALASTELFVQP